MSSVDMDELTTKNLIIAVPNEQSTWDANLNASEDDTDLACKRISQVPVVLQMCQHPLRCTAPIC